MSPDRLDVVEDAIRHADDPVVSAPEIAELVLETSAVYDDVGDPRREALADLELLERAGDVASKQTGAHSRAWWHTDRVRDAPPDVDDGLDADHEPILEDHTDGSVDAGAGGAREKIETGSAADDRDRLEDALADWRPGRSRAERIERVEIGIELLEWLRDHADPVRRSDVLAETADELAPDSQSDDTYWRKTARPALKHAADAGLVDVDDKEYVWSA